MRSKSVNPATLLGVLSILFAITLGGTPPAGNQNSDGASEVSSAVGSIATTAATPATAGIALAGVGPIPLDIQLLTIVPGEEKTAPFALEVHKLLPLSGTAEASVMAPDKKSKPEVLRHVVRDGETVWDIAKAYNVDVDTILACNDLGNANRLKIGQELKVLNVKGVLHTVQQGESLWTIAKNYKVDVGNIVQANVLTSPERLQPKQELIIPGAKPRDLPNQSTAARVLVVKGRLQKAFEWPARGRISSRFGMRWGRMHEGLDIAVNTGTPVRAAAAGRVTFSGMNGSYGYLIKIDHGNGVETRYAHNSNLLVKVGAQVAVGQVIARSGNTGRSTGPHLHFEIRLNGRAYNPLDYLR